MLCQVRDMLPGNLPLHSGTERQAASMGAASSDAGRERQAASVDRAASSDPGIE